MRRTRSRPLLGLLGLFAVLALLLAGCGGDSDGEDEAADGADDAADVVDDSADVADEPEPTPAPEPEPEPDPEPTPAPEPEPAPAPALPVGTTTGAWNNTTFGSTGAASVAVADGDVFVIALDITDGFVLGAGIQEIIDLELPAADLADGVTVDGGPLGTMTVTIVDGTIDVVSVDVPVPGIAGFTATATITDTMLSGTYEVQFDAGEPAVGTFEFALG